MDRKILVVDDEASIRILLDRALRTAGCTVLTAASAEQALELLAKERVQVHLLDLQLPGMSGIDLCRRIRSDRPVDCIYALTGYASLYDLVQCREAGFDDYFTKPFDLELITRTVGDAFERLERWTGEVKRGTQAGLKS